MLKKIDQYDTSETFHFFYAERKLGRFMIKWGTDSPSIWSVEIDAEYRGMGLGKQMMEECLDFIRQDASGVSKVYLYVETKNTPAVKLYRSLGFVFTGDSIRNGETERMEIEL